MTPRSVVLARLSSWYRACELWGFVIDPPLTAATLSHLDDGVVHFRAVRSVADGPLTMTLTVVELWTPGSDPNGNHKLEADGCFVEALSWHLQVGGDAGDVGAERLDVVLHPDDLHPRVHRHPYGSPNSVRLPSRLPPPEQWLHRVGQALEKDSDHLGQTASDDE